MSFEALRDLTVKIEECRLEPLRLETSAGWTRHTTLVCLRGAGHEGVGEDVTYQAEHQQRFRRWEGGAELRGVHSLDGFSRLVDRIEPRHEERLYRRWAFESAALDLALRQAGRSLAEALGRGARPVRFVASMPLDGPGKLERLERMLAADPGLRFKIDYAESWTPERIERIAATGAIDVVDLKGHYRTGDFRGPPADPVAYRRVAESFPDAWLEDPEWNDETARALAPFLARVTWDAPLHSLADLVRLPFQPACVNVKPSRFGFVRELFRVYDYCEGLGIATYGGGQFELGAGRRHIQMLAALFHADAPNDVAPSQYNATEMRDGLPRSPIALDERPGI